MLTAGLACLFGCYFAACAIAVRNFSRARMADLLEERDRADELAWFLERVESISLVCGFVRTLAVLVVMLSIVIYFDARISDSHIVLRYVLALAVAGLLVSVFNVAVPISWARYQPERLLVASMPVLRITLAVLKPFVVTLHLFDPIIRRISGVEADEPKDAETQASEAIMSVVEDYEGDETVDREQKQMIEAVFDFSSTTAGEIMTPRTEVRGLELGAKLEQVRTFILTEGHSRIPVYSDTIDDIVGILYAKDLLQYLATDKAFDLKTVLREALMVPETKSVRDLLAEFRARKVHIAIVLDEYGGTAGLVTIEDILEELVGEIEDEYEPGEEKPAIRALDESTWEVDARVYIDDLNDELGIDLPEDEDYDTVGGYVFSSLGHVPEVGESFDADEMRFTVTHAERTRVISVKVERLARETSGRSANGNGAQGK